MPSTSSTYPPSDPYSRPQPSAAGKEKEDTKKQLTVVLQLQANL